MGLVLAEPLLEIEVVVLLAPEHPGEGLAMDKPRVVAERARRDTSVELVGIRDTAGEHPVEIAEAVVRRGPGQPDADRLAAAGRHLEHVMRGGLGSLLRWIDDVALPGDDVPVKRILDVGRSARLPPELTRVALVFCEQQLRRPLALQRVGPELVMGGFEGAAGGLANRRDPVVDAP